MQEFWKFTGLMELLKTLSEKMLVEWQKFLNQFSHLNEYDKKELLALSILCIVALVVATTLLINVGIVDMILGSLSLICFFIGLGFILLIAQYF